VPAAPGELAQRHLCLCAPNPDLLRISGASALRDLRPRVPDHPRDQRVDPIVLVPATTVSAVRASVPRGIVPNRIGEAASVRQ
jgi:hypothetical protein